MVIDYSRSVTVYVLIGRLIHKINLSIELLSPFQFQTIRNSLTISTGTFKNGHLIVKLIANQMRISNNLYEDLIMGLDSKSSNYSKSEQLGNSDFKLHYLSLENSRLNPHVLNYSRQIQWIPSIPIDADTKKGG